MAIELPNGNILSNDDYNHRIIVIDKQTKKIIWQYGVTGKPGAGADQLNIPDGLDIIKQDAASSSNQTLPLEEGTTEEKRELLGQLRGKLVLTDKRISLKCLQ